MSSDVVLSLDMECFFIAPIGKEDTPVRKRSDSIFKFIVARAAAELGLTAVRGDQLSEPGQITLQVIDHVLGARAAVADLTGLNPNVFYELAVRHTARLPTALIAEKDCVLPFDIAQMRTIFFDSTDLGSADACRASIVEQLRKSLDNKTVDSPIATAVEVRALQSGDKVERNIAELLTVAEDIAKSQQVTLLRIDSLASALADFDESHKLPTQAPLPYPGPDQAPEPAQASGLHPRPAQASGLYPHPRPYADPAQASGLYPQPAQAPPADAPSS
jgi:hypothetical protein